MARLDEREIGASRPWHSLGRQAGRSQRRDRDRMYLSAAHNVRGQDS